MRTMILTMLAIAALSANGFAQGGKRDCPHHKQMKAGGRGTACPWMENRGGPGRPGGPMSDEMKEQMRAEHRAIRELGEAARAENDEAQKAGLVEQLRAKLGDVADRMQAHQEQRLAQAEERLADLKSKIEHSKANREQLIEEQVQRILSGERPPRPAAFDRFPHAKGGRSPGMGPGPCRGMPPPEEEMLDDMDVPPSEE